jgi:hypothetical protein
LRLLRLQPALLEERARVSRDELMADDVGYIRPETLAPEAWLPGSLVEGFHLTGLPVLGPTSLTPISSLLHPVLMAGAQYWVAVSGGTPTTFAFWGLTLFTGDPTAGGASRRCYVRVIGARKVVVS